jgi:hypothetical protein
MTAGSVILILNTGPPESEKANSCMFPPGSHGK